MGHFQKSRHGEISKTSHWRDFQNLAMARFSKLCYGEISKLCYGEIHSGIASLFLDYATRKGHPQGEKQIRKRKRKGKVMMAKTRPVKGWGPK